MYPGNSLGPLREAAQVGQWLPWQILAIHQMTEWKCWQSFSSSKLKGAETSKTEVDPWARGPAAKVGLGGTTCPQTHTPGVAS